MNKKAASEMWWIIIGAVIALIVLIILLVMFTGKTKNLEGGLGSCSTGGFCVAEDKCPAGTSESDAFECADNNKPRCCVGIPRECTDFTTEADCGSKDARCIEGYCYPQLKE